MRFCRIHGMVYLGDCSYCQRSAALKRLAEAGEFSEQQERDPRKVIMQGKAGFEKCWQEWLQTARPSATGADLMVLKATASMWWDRGVVRGVALMSHRENTEDAGR